MFCPNCGANQSEELRFCKSCGTNLQTVRQAVAVSEPGEKFDWGKTWVAEMFLSEGERKRRQEELERQRGITPEVKRYTEIKAGVITACVGIGLAIFLGVFMEGIIGGGKVPPDAASILARLWVVGIFPFVVGMALLINGIFVSRKLVEAARRELPLRPDALEGELHRPSLRSADTGEIIPAGYSVTEETTRHLSEPARKP